MYFNKSESISLLILLLIAAASISLEVSQQSDKTGAGNVVCPHQNATFHFIVLFFYDQATEYHIDTDKDTTINIIKSSQVSSASVCKVCIPTTFLKDKCSLGYKLTKPKTIYFNCLKPQDIFRVEIIRNIACTSTLCDSIIQSDFGSSNLSGFNRTFIWKNKANSQKQFRINFAKKGLRQIAPSNRCPDKHTYTLQAEGNVLLGKYCLSGTISSATILGAGSFSLDLPAGQEQNRGQFPVSVGEEIKIISKISVTLQKGSLSCTLLSPNYPDRFPNNSVMEWDFEVPNQHKATINFRNLNWSGCLKIETTEEYKRKWEVLDSFVQPRNIQPVQSGSFLLWLKNCEPSAMISMNLTVSASKTSSTEPGSFCPLCKVLGPVQKTIPCVVAAFVIILIIVLLVLCIVIKRKKAEVTTEVSVYNSGTTTFQPGPQNIPEGHVYTTIDDTLVYSHLLKREKNGVFNEYGSYQSLTEPKTTQVYDKASDDSSALLFQPQQGLPNRSPSYIELIVDNSIYNSEQNNKEEHPPSLCPREPKGGN